MLTVHLAGCWRFWATWVSDSGLRDPSEPISLVVVTSVFVVHFPKSKGSVGTEKPESGKEHGNYRGYWDYIGVYIGLIEYILGFFWENGKENGNYRGYRDCIGFTVSGWGWTIRTVVGLVSGSTPELSLKH